MRASINGGYHHLWKPASHVVYTDHTWRIFIGYLSYVDICLSLMLQNHHLKSKLSKVHVKRTRVKSNARNPTTDPRYISRASRVQHDQPTLLWGDHNNGWFNPKKRGCWWFVHPTHTHTHTNPSCWVSLGVGGVMRSPSYRSFNFLSLVAQPIY